MHKNNIFLLPVQVVPVQVIMYYYRDRVLTIFIVQFITFVNPSGFQ